MTVLEALFAPRGIAVVGASTSPGKLGAAMMRSLTPHRGPVVGVNPRSPDPNQAVHASFAEAVAASDEPLDLAVICVPAAATPAALRSAAEAGVRAAVVCAGGFAEAGEDGVRLQAEVAEIADSRRIRVLGPNTSGFFVPADRLLASFVPGVEQIQAGPVSVVAASGGVNHAVSFLLDSAGVGVRLGVGLGNAADLSAPDVMDHLRSDPQTTAVALHVEAVQDGPRWIEAVTALSAVKPVVALVVGRSDVGDFARSHTGALATSWRTTRAVLRQAGAVLVDDEDELVDAVAALSLRRLRPSRRPGVGVVTGQAGPGLLLTDALRSAGVAVPELSAATRKRLATLLPPLTYQANPVDTGRPGPTFSQVIETVAGDDAIDVVAVYGLTEAPVVDLPAAVACLGGTVPALLGIGGPDTEVAKALADARAHGTPSRSGPTALARAVTALVRDASQRAGTPTAEPSADIAPVPVGPWDEGVAKDILDDLGVRTPDRRRCGGRAAAHRALSELGVPVAVKILDAAILHKTDIGGVHLDINDDAALDQAMDALEAVGAAEVLVETMARPGVDLIVGARRDPVFGPLVLVGLGGTAAEVHGDVAIRYAAVNTPEAESMIDDLSGRALLDGWRGGPRLDRTELATIVRTVAQLLVASPHVQELEINPLRLTDRGLIALDAVIVSNDIDPSRHSEEDRHAQTDH
jgi:acetate---CoA ligase (ADP-forming)